jgi:putative ABC transport system substrate-binding protein
MLSGMSAVDVRKPPHPKKFERAFNRATHQGAGALLVLPVVLFALHQRQIAALAVKNRLPTIFYQRSFAEAGGLMAYGPRLSDLWRHVAVQVDRILKGTKPRDLPVEQQPMKFELVINLETTKALGLTIPATLLFRADEVIQ